jgi:exodeoxyribonuclease VII large subunit
MPELLSNKKVFSLLEVTQSIQKTLLNRYSSSFWIKAEMNKLNHYLHSGHCYPELLQKENGQVVAQMRCLIWNFDFERIKSEFLRSTAEPPGDGINIMALVSVLYDPNHGLSLRLHDIDPTYTLGELEREKRLCIARLKEEGILEANKKLPFPLLPKRLAIISVETSKGFADFKKITSGRMNGFVMEYMLFPAQLQGDKSVSQIIAQLNSIQRLVGHFDLVAIIRGGGGDIGLSSFNNYELARTIALFPLPVITGIGHATNETVAEIVAHTNSTTPTELADMLMECFEDFSAKLHESARHIHHSLHLVRQQEVALANMKQELANASGVVINQSRHLQHAMSGNISALSRLLVNQTSQQLNRLSYALRLEASSHINHRNFDLKASKKSLSASATACLSLHVGRLDQSEKLVNLLNPVNLFRKGYSITLYQGKPLMQSAGIEAGAILTTMLADGILHSKVIDTNTEQHEG